MPGTGVPVVVVVVVVVVVGAGVATTGVVGVTPVCEKKSGDREE